MKERGAILAVEAHPDDLAATASGYTAKIINQGHDVDSIMITDANWEGNGQHRIHGEQRSMMNTLGMRRLYPIGEKIGIKDGASFTMTEREIVDTTFSVIQALLYIVDSAEHEKDPYEGILTFGSDGWTDHPDHKLAHAAAQAVFRMRSGISNLVTPAMSPEERALFKEDYKDNDFYPSLPVVDISTYEPIDIAHVLPRKIEAIKAHKSQMKTDGEKQIERLKKLKPVEYIKVYSRS